jgi:hypothetical protein
MQEDLTDNIQTNMEYSITLEELIQRPSIRNDYDGDGVWMNKMTNEEYDQFNEESRQICIEEGVEDKFPDINAAILSKHIDRTILYKLFSI